MLNLLFLVFASPLLGFIVLSLGRGRISQNLASVIGVGSIGVSALVTLGVGIQLLGHPTADGSYTQVLWQWMQVGSFSPRFALRLDGLSLTMCGVITGVGFLIHLFASWYMRGDEGFTRFFSYMNLFVASMLFLVLGDNLLFLYFGWEGVGLCSYLLIGFWYQDSANGSAARKAFIVTRVGDTFMAIGLFLLFRELGTLDIQQAMGTAAGHFEVGSHTVTAIAFLLLGGAVGKSAQLPLQTWLPDAMAGPTPVSALIHAATMVTAGVYLIARTHVLFELAPLALHWVGIIGAATLLLAGFTALVQTDIKRILAYSTMSQIGYMFLALGASAWQAAIFHLMTHAFFKALLFMAAGAVILACHHEQDIFRMGGLRKKLPLPFWSFIVGGAALCAVPYLTAGFFSKDEILWQAYAGGHTGLFAAGLFGAFLTSIYTFRLIFIVFFGEAKNERSPIAPHAPARVASAAVGGGHAHQHGGDEAADGAAHAPVAHHDSGPPNSGLARGLPLLVLLVLSTFVGGMIHPPLSLVLPAGPGEGIEGEGRIALMSGSVALLGIAISALLFLGKRSFVGALARSSAGQLIGRYFYSAFGFDWLYDKLFVQPFLWFVRVNKSDYLDRAIMSIATSLQSMNGVLTQTQTGRIRWYAASVAVGAVLVIGVAALT